MFPFLSCFPQIRMIALCNSRAMGESDENSDIDLFIITKKNNLWTARCIVTALTTLLLIRRGNIHGLLKGSPEYIKRTKNKYCLSFFITEEVMNLDSIRIENDIYLDKWIRTLIPLINKDATYERFMNTNWQEAENAGSLVHNKENFLSSIFSFLSLFESLIRTLWLPRTLRTYEKLGKPWGVIISDTMLKFHDDDQRKVYRDSTILP